MDMERHFDAAGDRLVTVMSDGRQIDTADKVRELIAEFEELQRSDAKAAGQAER